MDAARLRAAGRGRFASGALDALAATQHFYGDAVITPAISILSAVEGLKLVDPRFGDWILPLTLALVVLLFAEQRFGTDRIGGMFVTVMAVWFATIGVLGGVQVARHLPRLAVRHTSAQERGQVFA